MKFLFTGRKFFYIAIPIIVILFTTGYEIQRNGAGASLKPAATVSSQALPSTEKPAGQAHARITSVSTERINAVQQILPGMRPSATAGILSVATQIATATPDANLPSLQSFIAQVTNGEAESLVGIYVKGIMALHIVQQPDGDPAYIDPAEGTATQFYKASLFGTVGLLAHNHLSGRYFFEIAPGTNLVLVYGNGRTSHYTVREIGDYQRLSLTDLRSDFVDLATNEKKSADELFAHYYQQKQTLTLQTCIAQNGISDWGVRFILARPLQIHPDKREVVLRSNP